MKIKTSELAGPALRYAVAVASGRYEKWISHPSRTGTSVQDIGLWKGKLLVYCPKGDAYERWEPDLDWGQGGPIIELENISPGPRPGYRPVGSGGFWARVACRRISDEHTMHGPTYLVASMRCYVSTRLGDEVEIPDELLG